MKNRYSITRWLLTAAVPALLLTACSKDNDTGDYPGTNESPGGDIRFEIGFATPAATAGANLPQTRVTTDSQFKSTWDDGDAIGIFACRKSETLSETPSGNVLNNIKLTYNNATGTWSGSAYWPADGSRIDFYAYYPYQGDGTLNPAAIAFSVKTDQRAAADYSASDLLTAKATNGSAGYGKGETVSLSFSHPLAMVQVSLDSQLGAIDPNEEVIVTLRDVKAKAGLNLGAVDNATPGSGVTLAGSDNNATAIKMYRVEQLTDANYRSSFTFRAVVPAQSLSENANIFQIANGDLLLRSSALTDNITMTGGKAETFTQKLPVYIHRVRIKAGTFLMGDDAGNSNEKPVHSVTLAKDFYMGKYQVTRAQYAAFLNAVGVAGVTIDNLARHNVSGYGEQNLFTVNQWG